MTKTKIAYLRHDEVTEKAVAEKMQETGLDQSKAIRLIIREWATSREQRIFRVDDIGQVRYADNPADKED